MNIVIEKQELSKIIKKMDDFNKMKVDDIESSLKLSSQNIPNIIYGDYIHKNKQIEVNLHGRTSSKIQYTKRDYMSIHPFDI